MRCWFDSPLLTYTTYFYGTIHQKPGSKQTKCQIGLLPRLPLPLRDTLHETTNLAVRQKTSINLSFHIGHHCRTVLPSKLKGAPALGPRKPPSRPPAQRGPTGFMKAMLYRRFYWLGTRRPARETSVSRSRSRERKKLLETEEEVQRLQELMRQSEEVSWFCEVMWMFIDVWPQ